MRETSKILASLFVVLGLLLTYSSAWAAAVCGKVRYFDSRLQRDVASFLVTPATANTNRVVGNIQIDLYDLDGDYNDVLYPGLEPLDDDYLASTWTDGAGNYCFTGIGTLEDVYLVTHYENKVGTVYDSTGNPAKTASSTDFDIGGDILKDWNITCSNDLFNITQGFCNDLQWADAFFFDEQNYANLLATMSDLDVRATTPTVNGSWDRGKIKIFHPDFPSSHSSSCGSSLGKSVGFRDICINAGMAVNNQVVMHEIGHALHRRHLGYSGSLTDGTCGTGYDWDGSGSQKCATAEGWASFVAAAMYFDQNVTTAWAGAAISKNTDGHTTRGNTGLQTCVSKSSSPETAPGNVTRFFWDLYDQNAVDEASTYWFWLPTAGYDNSQYSFATLAAVWQDFGFGVFSGTGDRGAYELGPNGRNVWDYQHYLTDASSEIRLNCLYGQER